MDRLGNFSVCPHERPWSATDQIYQMTENIDTENRYLGFLALADVFVFPMVFIHHVWGNCGCTFFFGGVVIKTSAMASLFNDRL